MSRRFVSSWGKSFASFVKQWFRGGRGKRGGRRVLGRRRLLLEPLESRSLMASDFGRIAGRVYVDVTGNGFTAGEAVNGASVQLYLDDGDSTFDSGDTLQSTATSDVNGQYAFNRLSAGNYFVQQPSQTVGSTVLSAIVSSMFTITSTEAQGIDGTIIDSFTTAGPTISALAPVGNSNSSSGLASEAVGGERDLFTEITSGGAGESVSFSVSSGKLNFNPSFAAQGRYIIAWDGTDGSSTINGSGLGGIDLTTGNTTNSLRLVVGADHAGGTARARVYSSSANWSQSLLTTVPNTGSSTTELFFDFSDFTTGGGTGASFASVGAIEMEFNFTQDGTDGVASLLRPIGPSTETQDFSNCADVGITKDVDTNSPVVGDNVTFTITVNNATNVGAATGLVVTDSLPTGLTFVSASTATGSYNSTTGQWSVGTLNSGSTATLTIVALVSAAGSITNTASITSMNQCDTSTTNNTSSETLAVSTVDLRVTKTVDNSTPNRNANVTFTVSVFNDGTANETGVSLSDPLPSGLTFVSATPSQGSYSSSTGVWTVGALNAGASATMTIVATVATAGAKTNTAQVSAQDRRDLDSTANNSVSTEDDQASVTVTPNALDLVVTKTVNNSTPNQNENITFTIGVSNSGSANATNVTLTDTLPTGLTFVSATPTQGTFSSTTNTWTIGSINNGASVSMTIVATVATSGVKTNTATLGNVDQFDTNSNNNAASVAVTPRISDITVAKSVDDNTPNQNQNITFTVTATNNGPDDATGVTVTDTLPSGLTFVSSNTATGSYSSTTGVWTVGALNNAASASLQIVATANTSSAQTNTATVSAAAQFDSNTANNTASVSVTPNVSDLAVAKVVDNANPSLNGTVNFTITVSNNGPIAATSVVLTDQLPTGITFVTSTPSQGTYDSTTGVWTVGSIANGASVTLGVRGTLTSAGAKTNTAALTSLDQFDSVSTNNTASVTVTPRRVSKRDFICPK